MRYFLLMITVVMGHSVLAADNPGTLRPEVIKAMRAVHSGFKGQRGRVAQLGDSITYSMAFWSPMSWDDPQRFLTRDDGLPKMPAKGRWRDTIKGARDKGPKFGNYSGWRVGLNTIPPRRGHDAAVKEINQIIRALALKRNLPLADFHAACLHVRPGNSWDGTIISKDGVHPSGGKTNLYTEAILKTSGYALRNWGNFLAVREVYFRILHPEKKR